MKAIMTPAIREVIEEKYYFPALSIIMPFETKMTLKTRLKYSLTTAADKMERELLENYPDDMGMLVIQKLRAIINNLDYNTHTNSIAIYVSPVFEKVLYLEIAVEEKLIVDESFEIGDLVYSKKQLQQYLVLLLSDHGSRIYLGNSNALVMIVSNRPQSFYTYGSEVPGRILNFSDRPEQKEIVIERFLQHIDNSLNIILNTDRLPLFVVGPERILGLFKNITRHTRTIIELVPCNYEEVTLVKLKEIMRPQISDWGKVKQKNLLNQLEEAMGKQKLAVGMKDVWREAAGHKGRLLVVEKKYTYAGAQEICDEIINKAIEPYNKFSYIKDTLDDVMEKVWEAGGDVEFVEEGLLKGYQQIALIQY